MVWSVSAVWAWVEGKLEDECFWGTNLSGFSVSVAVLLRLELLFLRPVLLRRTHAVEEAQL